MLASHVRFVLVANVAGWMVKASKQTKAPQDTYDMREGTRKKKKKTKTKSPEAWVGRTRRIRHLPGVGIRGPVCSSKFSSYKT
ncbi:hypothetical protein V8C43DRAFT_286798 [Trichoderma afarasin]